jgi:plasmid stabilization system protein ParE
MRRAFLQQKAKEDVREIVLYIADDNLKAAEAFRLALERVRLTLADLPESGDLPCSPWRPGYSGVIFVTML